MMEKGNFSFLNMYKPLLIMQMMESLCISGLFFKTYAMTRNFFCSDESKFYSEKRLTYNLPDCFFFSGGGSWPIPFSVNFLAAFFVSTDALSKSHVSGQGWPYGCLIFRFLSMEALYTKGDLAKIAKVSIRTIDNWIQRKQIHCSKFGRTVRFSKQDIEGFFQKHRIT